MAYGLMKKSFFGNLQSSSIKDDEAVGIGVHKLLYCSFFKEWFMLVVYHCHLEAAICDMSSQIGNSHT